MALQIATGFWSPQAPRSSAYVWIIMVLMPLWAMAAFRLRPMAWSASRGPNGLIRE